MIFLKAFIGTLVTFLVVDIAWISMVVRGMYQREIGPMLLDSPNMTAAAIFYLAYVAGIVVLAVQPAIASGSVRVAVINGAVLGAIAYGTFTMTNYAVLKGWTAQLVWTDIVWGTFLTALCAVAGYFAARL